MGERVKQIFGRVREFFANMSKRLKVALILILVATVALIVGLSVYRSNRPYTILFKDLSSADMSLVMTYLSENNITDYQVQSNNTILVRESQEAALKAAIYQQGYPTSGFGYDTYLNNVGMLSSQGDRERLTLYQLQDNLSAVIRQMDNVLDAYVIINAGSDTSYILADNVTEATATVSVTMRTGTSLTEGQVTAIRNAVSNAVEGLDVTNVEIHDQAGTNYGAGTGTANASDTANLKLQLQAQVDEETKNKILDLLVPMFGRNNVSVTVHSTVDISDTYKETLLYIEPEWAGIDTLGQGIIGSRSWNNYLLRDDNATAGGVVGTSTNADLNEYIVRESDLTGNEAEISSAGEINYDVSYEKTQSRPLGAVTDLSVSVVINSDLFEQQGRDAPNVSTLVPMVARAAGIGAEYQEEVISIGLYPFYVAPTVDEPTPEEPGGLLDNLPSWALYALIGGCVLFALLLVLILILSRRAKKKKKAAKQLEEQRALAQMQATMSATMAPEMHEQGADIMDLKSERSMELRKDVRQFAEDNPAIAAQMVKNWLRGSEEQHS